MEKRGPTGLVAFNLGTVQYAPNDAVALGVYAGMTAEEIAGGSVDRSRLRGDLPVSVRLGALRLAAVPGVHFDAGRNFSSLKRAIPAAGGAVSADYRTIRMTIAGETRWYFARLRSGDIQQRYGINLSYHPPVSPVAFHAALVLNNYRTGYGVRAEVGLALAVQ